MPRIVPENHRQFPIVLPNDLHRCLKAAASCDGMTLHDWILRKLEALPEVEALAAHLSGRAAIAQEAREG